MQRLPQQGRGPLAVGNSVRLPFRCSRDLRLCLGECVLIQVLRQNSTAALQRMFAIASVRDEMFQPAEKKRAKPAFLAIGVRVGSGLDLVREQSWGEVLRVL